jgi:hypothetical protein
VWLLEEIDEKTTRPIVRVRSDYNPGLLSTLSPKIPNELGSFVMQPKTLRVLKQPAERDEAVDGQPCELYTYAGDNHNISANFGIAMQRTLAFFDKYVKDQ